MSDYTWYDVNPLNSIANIRQNHWTMNKGQRHSRLYGCSAAAALKGICYLTKYKLSAHTFVSPSADSRRAVVSNWRKNVQEVLVNHLGGLSLPRKSVVRLTDCPDMTLDVYRGRTTTTTRNGSKQDLLTCPPQSRLSETITPGQMQTYTLMHTIISIGIHLLKFKEFHQTVRRRSHNKLFSFENFKGAQLRPKTFWEKTGKYVVTSFLTTPPPTHTHTNSICNIL